MQVDAVRPEVGAAGQHQHAGRAGARGDDRLAQRVALPGAHRAVVEREVQHAYRPAFLVADRPPRRLVGFGAGRERQVRHPREPLAEHLRGGELERGVRQRIDAREVRDPHGAVARAAQDRPVARRHDGARCRAREARGERALGVGAEEAASDAQHLVAHARHAVGGADLPQHGGRGVARPVDRAVGLLHRRPQPSAHAGTRVVQRPRPLAAPDAVDRFAHRRQGRLGDLVAVQAAFRGVAHGEGPRRPDVARVHLAVRLEHGDAPLALALLHRPVERRGAAVALDAGVHDEAAMPPPHRLGDRALEEGRDDELGRPERDRLLGDAVVDVELERELVAVARELRPEPLRQAVERVAEEQDAHQQIRGNCSPASQSTMRRPPKRVSICTK